MNSNLLQMRADLVAAQAKRALVRVRRSIEPGWANGYVLQVGSHFFTLLLVSDLIIFNGFQVLRIKDVSALEVPAPHSSFVERALRLRGALAPPDPPVNMTDLKSLLVSVSSAFSLVTIHREIEDPEVCHIGAVQNIDGDTVNLRLINADGQWNEHQEMFALSEITRVDFGGLYEEALSLVVEGG